jgi:hypothetical protein
MIVMLNMMVIVYNGDIYIYVPTIYMTRITRRCKEWIENNDEYDVQRLNNNNYNKLCYGSIQSLKE